MPAAKFENETRQSLSRLKAKLEQRLKKLPDKEPVVVVGYSAKYAIWVHENTEMKLKGKPRPSGLGKFWDGASGPGSSKFLETPYRQNKQTLVNLIKDVMTKTGNLLQALTVAGLRLQRESMQKVPVEYGNLRASAFTKQE